MDLSDTLYICEGESVQLQTSQNQESYQWNPDVSINDPTIFNPIVTPEETTIYTVSVEVTMNPNLINNGDFSQGNVGFYSDYFLFETEMAPDYYTVFNSAYQVNDWLEDCDDKSDSGDNYMMIVDGALNSSWDAWCQDIIVEAGSEYTFSAWVTNLFWAVPGTLRFTANGASLGPVLETGATCNWQEFTADWYSGGGGQLSICIASQIEDSWGNDFALDDIQLRLKSDLEDFVDTFVVIVSEMATTEIDTIICANESIIYDGISVAANSQSIFNYNTVSGCDSFVYLNVGQIDTSYSETLIDTFCMGDTAYYMNLAITQDTAFCDLYINALGCDSTICIVYSFLSSASINADVVNPSCTGYDDGILTTEILAGFSPYEYAWNTGSSQSILQDISAGEYMITVTDAKNCVAEQTFIVEDPPPIIIDYTIIEPSCFGLADGQINIDASGGEPAYEISFGDYPTSLDGVFENVMGGTYEAYVRDAKGCESSFLINVNSPPQISIDLPSNLTMTLGDDLEIDATINASSFYEIQWFPTVDLDCSNCEDPVTSSIFDVNYYLQVEDEYGCIVLDSVAISVVNDFAIYIPNAFSPNGDGLNDEFEIYSGKGVREILSLQIFNRWGAEVYKLEKFRPDDEHAWDGRMKSEGFNGGVFVYVVDVLFVDGVKRVFSGDVLLVK